MTNVEELTEVLALHGYKYRGEASVLDQGVTHYFQKHEKEGSFIFSFYGESQMDHNYWRFSLKKSIDFFPKDAYAHPILTTEITNIHERDLKLLSVFEKRLSEINSEPIE